MQEANRPEDWVQMDVTAEHTRFIGSGKNRKIKKQTTVPANIKASVDNNIIAISDRANDIMIAVSLDDMTAIMAGVYDYHRKVEEGCQQETSEGAPDVDAK